MIFQLFGSEKNNLSFVVWGRKMSGFDYSKWDRLEISDDESTSLLVVGASYRLLKEHPKMAHKHAEMGQKWNPSKYGTDRFIFQI